MQSGNAGTGGSRSSSRRHSRSGDGSSTGKGDRLQALVALKNKRYSHLVREKQTIKALQIAVAMKQKEIDDASKEHFLTMEKMYMRQQHRLPLWGLTGLPQAGQSGDLQYLTDLRERRAALYEKVGRPDAVGNERTYLATYELHPQDLERQAAWEDALSAGIN